MTTDKSNKKLFLGILVGAGLGVVTAYLLSPTEGARRRAALLERVVDICDQLRSLGRDAAEKKDLKTERACRTLLDRIERFRTAGM
jgi:gas vesicle protein